MKLTIELVPTTCWYSNVRSNVSKAEWDIIRKESYSNANNCCEICKSTGKQQGYNHNVVRILIVQIIEIIIKDLYGNIK